MKRVITADLFCGAGGASTGIHRACNKLGVAIKNYCVNHWDVAIKTHCTNHPNDVHECAGIETVIPSEFVKEGYLDLLWASPSCTHHSRAKGGKPRDNQLRAQPNLILDWLDMLHVKRLIVENVPEFVSWGPINQKGKPIASKRGASFQAWIASLEARNYTFEYMVLNCADYGDVTTRERFFLQAVKRGCGKISWPQRTHAKNPEDDLFSVRPKRWRGIGECLDLTDIGTPISQRKKPLARATMLRIAEGIRKFHGEQFVMDFLGTDKPSASGRIISKDDPLTTQHCSNRYGVATPFVVDFMRNGKPGSINEPIQTQHCKDRFGIATPFVVKWEKNSKPIALNEPITTQTSAPKFTLCTPIIYDFSYGGKLRSSREPLGVQTTRANMSVVFPVADGSRLVDVCFRMMRPDELKRATGFGDDYFLAGNQSEQVKQIGNAVPVNTAESLAYEALGGRRF